MICKIIINLLCSIIFFYLIDFIIFIIGDNNKNRRWYLVHAIANTFVVYYGINNLVECFKDPFLIMKEKYSKNTFLLDFLWFALSIKNPIKNAAVGLQQIQRGKSG